MSFKIRPGAREDCPLILTLIQQLADYEKLSKDVVATPKDLEKTLFGPHPCAEVIIGEDQTGPVAFALFFHNYSTFLGKPGLYLEDLFVLPSTRGKGYGKLMLAQLAKIAVERDCGRFEWSVLNWNEPAIGFYKSLGAVPQDGWSVFRMTGDALKKLASG